MVGAHISPTVPQTGRNFAEWVEWWAVLSASVHYSLVMAVLCWGLMLNWLLEARSPHWRWQNRKRQQERPWITHLFFFPHLLFWRMDVFSSMHPYRTSPPPKHPHSSHPAAHIHSHLSTIDASQKRHFQFWSGSLIRGCGVRSRSNTKRQGLHIVAKAWSLLYRGKHWF